MLLVDTSAWIEVFGRPGRITLDDMVDDRDRIVTCLPVIQEVLQGFEDERACQIARIAMSSSIARSLARSAMRREYVTAE